MRFRPVAFLLLFCIAFSSPLAWAGSAPMTKQGPEQGRTFGRYLQKAVAVAGRNDRMTTQTQLREGLRASAYSLQFRDDLLTTSWMVFRGTRLTFCGGPPQQPLPAWILAAQAAIGDVEGAEVTARNQTGASQSLAAFWIISEVQAGDSSTLDTTGNKAWVNKEWRYYAKRYYRGSGSTPITTLDAAPLKRFVSAQPDREAARQTLRKALPYARAIRGDALPLFLLGCRQLQLGDLAGAFATLIYLPLNPSLYIALALLAVSLMWCRRRYLRWRGRINKKQVATDTALTPS